MGARAVGIGGCECDEAGLEQAQPVRSAVAPCLPTSDGALRHNSQPRSARGRTAQGRRRPRGSARGDRAPARAPPPRPERRHRRQRRSGLRSRATSPGTRSGRYESLEHESAGSRAAISVGYTSQPRRRSSPQRAASGRIAANDSWNSSIRAGVHGNVSHGACTCGVANRISVPASQASRQNARPCSIDFAPSSPEGTT